VLPRRFLSSNGSLWVSFDDKNRSALVLVVELLALRVVRRQEPMQTAAPPS